MTPFLHSLFIFFLHSLILKKPQRFIDLSFTTSPPLSLSFFPQWASKTTVQILFSRVQFTRASDCKSSLRALAPNLDHTSELLGKLLKILTSGEPDLTGLGWSVSPALFSKPPPLPPPLQSAATTQIHFRRGQRCNPHTTARFPFSELPTLGGPKF